MTRIKFMVFIIFLLIISVEKISAQTNEHEVFPLTIPFIEIYDLDTTYIPTWETQTIPPNTGYGINDFVYKLVITITVMGKETWNKPFTLIYDLPGYKREYIVLNEELYELSPDIFNKFLVEIHTKQKGWAKFELANYDETTGGIYVPANSYPLRKRDFLLE